MNSITFARFFGCFSRETPGRNTREGTCVCESLKRRCCTEQLHRYCCYLHLSKWDQHLQQWPCVSSQQATGSLCVTGQHFEWKAMCHQSCVDVRSALAVLCFQQIPQSTKLIPCDWPGLSALHCSGGLLARSVSCAQTKLSCHSGQYCAPLCWDDPRIIWNLWLGRREKGIRWVAKMQKWFVALF